MGRRRNEPARQEHRTELKKTLSLTSYTSKTECDNKPREANYSLGNNFGWVILANTQVADGSFFPNIDHYFKGPKTCAPSKNCVEVTYVLCIKKGEECGALDEPKTEKEPHCPAQKSVSYDTHEHSRRKPRKSSGDSSPAPEQRSGSNGWWCRYPDEEEQAREHARKKKTVSSGASADSGDDKKKKPSKKKEEKRRRRSTSCFGRSEKSDSGGDSGPGRRSKSKSKSKSKPKKEKKPSRDRSLEERWHLRASAGADKMENDEEGKEEMVAGPNEIYVCETIIPSTLTPTLNQRENKIPEQVQTAPGTDKPSCK